jgi:hypothetical protein
MVCRDDDFRSQLLPDGAQVTPVSDALIRGLTLPPASLPDRDRDILGPLSSDVAWAGGQVSRQGRRAVHHRTGGWRDLLLGPPPT